MSYILLKDPNMISISRILDVFFGEMKFQEIVVQGKLQARFLRSYLVFLLCGISSISLGFMV
jgi:hypothetical protein